MVFEEKCVDTSAKDNTSSDEVFKKSDVNDKLIKLLSKQHECYVLITCGRPSKEGKMNVEMTYEGDALLASYLIDSASEILQEEQPPCFS